jgi:hypothetical protein
MGGVGGGRHCRRVCSRCDDDNHNDKSMGTVGRYDVGLTHVAWDQRNDKCNERDGTCIIAQQQWHITGMPWHTLAIDVAGFDVIIIEPCIPNDEGGGDWDAQDGDDDGGDESKNY